MKILCLFLSSIFLLLDLSAQETPDPKAAIAALRQGDHEEAIRVLSGDLAALAAASHDFDEVELRLHQARAHQLAGKNADAVALCDECLKRFPDSSWRHKVVFLKAEALASQRKFQQALDIYQKEAGRIFSKTRQDEVAGHLITFAELFATEPAPEELDAPPADYVKALILYGQVLDTDCSRQVREKVQSRIVVLHGFLKQWDKAEAAALVYLGEFDPDWRGTFGSVRRLTGGKNLQAKLAGVDRFKVRFRHAEALHRMNRRPDSVRYLEELEEMTKDTARLNALRADAMWLRLMAMTQNGEVHHPDEWIKHARIYLGLYPNHIWAPQVAYKIASVFRSSKQWDRARGAYQDYLDGKGYGAPREKPLTLDQKSAGEFEKRKREHEVRRESASFEIGAIFLAEKKFNEAEAQWSKTAKDFPNGEKWAECQRGLVQVDFERALESVRKVHKGTKEEQAGLREEARKSIESFLTNHPLDNRLPQLMFVLGELSYFQAIASKEGEDFKLTEGKKAALEKAIGDWRRLISKYPNSSQARAAELKVGGIYEHYLGDLEKAVEIYSGLKNGQSRKAVLMSKVLKASSPRVYGTTEKPQVSLELRNVEKVKVRQYWIDFESFFRKSQNLSDIENLDVDLVEPDKTWEATIPNFQRYLPMEHHLAIPFEEGKSGVCVIKVEGENLESTTVTVRSDIDLAVRSSRSEALVFSRDWKTGKVAPGVKLVLADGAKVIANGVTGDDGVWHYQSEDLKEVSELRVLGVSDRGMAGFSLPVAGLGLPAPLAARAQMTTARQIHRPGETVNLKIVVRDIKDGGFVVPAQADRNFRLRVFDEGGRLLKENKVTLSDFGTSKESFRLPERLRGNRVALSLEGELGGKKVKFGGSVVLSHQGLPWVNLELEFEKEFLAPGEVIKGKVSAGYRWGAPLVNRKVTLVLPGGLELELQTDLKGEASFEYPTKGKGEVALGFLASMPSTDARKASGTVRIVKTDYTLQSFSKRGLVISDRNVEIKLKSQSLNGEPVARKFRLVVERPVEEHPDPVLVEVPGLNMSRECLVIQEQVKEIEVETNGEKGEGSAAFKVAEGGSYLYRIFDGDRQVGQGRFTVSDGEDPTKLRLFGGGKPLSEGMTGRFELHSRLGDAVPALVCFEGDRLLEYRVVNLKSGFNEITLPLTAAHAPGIQVSVMALDGRELHQTSLIVTVRRNLKVEMSLAGVDGKTAKPGEKVKVSLLVKDAAGNPIQGETGIAVVRHGDEPRLPQTKWSPFQGDQIFGIFGAGSTCGFRHQGGQQGVNVAVQQEIQRQARGQRLALNRANGLPALVQQQQADFVGEGGGGGLGYLNAPIRTNPALNDQGQVANIVTAGLRFGQVPIHPGMRGGRASFDLQSKLVKTDQNGKAVIEVILPSDSDDWVIIGEAVTKSGAYGGTLKEVKIQEDLVVKIAAPDVMAEGDSFVPEVIVSRAKAEQSAKGVLKLTIQPQGQDAITLERNINLKKGQRTLEVGFKKLGVAKGSLKISAEVTLERGAKKDKRSFQVLPWGAPVVARGGVLAKPGKSSFKIDLAKGIDFDPMEIVIHPGVTAFLEALSSGGHEALAGSGMPLIGEHPAPALLTRLAVLRYGEKRGMAAGEITRLKKEAEGLVASLVVRQGSEGGWSGHAGRKKSDLIFSAVGFEALTKAKAAGIPVDGQVLGKAEQYLRSLITKSGDDHRALIQYALSVAAKGDFSACNRLFRSRAELSAFGRAHLAMAFIRLKRPEFAKQLLEDLGEISAGDIFTVGRALQGWASINANSPKAGDLENRIWNRCGAFGFVSDLQRSLGALGLSSLYEAREAANEDYRFVISVNGREVRRGDSKDLKSFGVVPVPRGILKEGPNEISVEIEGRGNLRAGTTVTGVNKKFPKENWDGALKVVTREFLHPGLTYRGLPLSARGRSPLSKVPVGDRVRVRIQAHHVRRENGEIVIWEKIPAGFDYLEGSLSGAHSGARIENGYLVITHVGIMPHDKSFYYEMVARTAGDWRVSPTTMFPIQSPERATYGPEGELVVLPRGKKAVGTYWYQVGERFELASLNFKDGNFKEAAKHLAEVRKDHPNYQAAEVARMTLWIETSNEKPNAQLIADAFEVLNELSPELEIPFEKILKVGNAYRELKEFERGMDVFLATLEAGFAVESFVGAALEDQGRFLDAVDYQKELWMDFPDYGDVANSYFALAQQVYAKAKDTESLTPKKGKKKRPTSRELYLESVKMLEQFRLTHPTHPLSDDGAFTIANALFTLKSYEEMVTHAKASREAYPKSDFAEAFQYLGALGNFWLRNYDEAFAASKVVAEGSGKDKNLAAYICAQILHAQRKTVDALKWYEKVKNEYPDAGDSIAWFEQKKISLEEVKVIRSGEKVELELKHRNIAKADLQIYRVDLMKLYLREKNLSNISKVNLAGIAPKHEMSVDLKNKQFSDQETKVELPMKEDGAYLVICRGDYLYSSGLVLVTPLKMEVQEIPREATIRVNLSDRATNKLLDGVHVKAIGSNDDAFSSGETDMRGLWTTSDVKGVATVIARDKQGRYAFYRGTRSLRNDPVPVPQAPEQRGQFKKGYYNSNNLKTQDAIWDDNSKKFDKLRRGQGKGVKVNKAIKK